MRIFKIIAIILAISTNIAYADTANNDSATYKPVLNKVTYEFSAEEWAKTSSATVSVNIDAVFDENKLEEVRTDILKKLNQLTPNAQWHLTNFNRSPDQSGLERLQVQAQARVVNTALGDLRAQAKSLSKPGETFTIANIDYTPSLAETEATRLALHKQIYNQAKAEITELNQLYPDQKYYLHSIKFMPAQSRLEPMPMMRMGYATTSVKAAAMPMMTTDKIILMAQVTIASTITVAK